MKHKAKPSSTTPILTSKPKINRSKWLKQMYKSWKRSILKPLHFTVLQDNSGAATLEIVIIIAVLLAIALIFNSELRSFAQSIFDKVFDEQSVLSQI